MEQELMKEERMTSLQIAEEIGKEHKNVLRDIRNMESAWFKVNGRRFELVGNQDYASFDKIVKRGNVALES